MSPRPTDSKETRAPSASTAHLRGIQGVGVLRRRQERDMHLCGDVADGRDFVLVWTAAVQNALRGVTQLLYGVKSHSLNKCTFHLRGEKGCVPQGDFPGAFLLPVACLTWRSAVLGAFWGVSESVPTTPSTAISVCPIPC